MSSSISDSKKIGRPKTGIGRAIGLRLYPELEKRLDVWIAEQDDPPSRPEAIRVLMKLGLDAWATAKPSPAPAKPTRARKAVKATKTAPPKKTRVRRP
jgi:hypothetical protein